MRSLFFFLSVPFCLSEDSGLKKKVVSNKYLKNMKGKRSRQSQVG